MRHLEPLSAGRSSLDRRGEHTYPLAVCRPCRVFPSWPSRRAPEPNHRPARVDRVGLATVKPFVRARVRGRRDRFGSFSQIGTPGAFPRALIRYTRQNGLEGTMADVISFPGTV